MADVPTTKKKLQGLMEKFMRMRDQGVQIPKPPPQLQEKNDISSAVFPLKVFESYSASLSLKQVMCILQAIQRVGPPGCSILSLSSKTTEWMTDKILTISGCGTSSSQQLRLRSVCCVAMHCTLKIIIIISLAILC